MMHKTFSTMAKGWMDALGAYCYPEVCQICEGRRATPDGGYVCSDCRRSVRYVEAPFCQRCGLPYEGEVTTAFECSHCHGMKLHFRFARAAVVLGGVIQGIIHRYKYNGAVWFEPYLAGLLVNRATPLLRQERWDMIIPVPLHPAKLREREFNQAERLARPLSRATEIPLNARALRRVEPTRTQTMLTPAQRIANVRGAFALRRGQRVDGGRVVLVDDVLTTGATTDACARVLLQAGAEAVCVWTVSRAVLQPPTSRLMI